MKKRIIGIILTAFMLIGILPLGAIPVFADDAHDLKVYRSGVFAKEGIDYDWDIEKNQLTIMTDGLTVSGTTEKENIVAIKEVQDLTIENLSISVPDGFSAYFYGNVNLILKGNNIISTSGDSYNGIFFNSDSKISGRGNLTVSSPGSAVKSRLNIITFETSGTVITAGGVNGIEANGLDFTSKVGKLIAYGGGENGAIGWHSAGWNYLTGYDVKFSDELNIKGSAEENVPEGEITGETTCVPGNFCVKTGDAIARSVLITHKQHDYSAGVYIDNGNTHSRVCDCGYVEAPANHVYTDSYNDNGDGTHSLACECGHLDTPADHFYPNPYADNGDGTHSLICVCGYVDTPVDHVYTEPYVDNGDGTHSRVCVCGVSDDSEKLKHKFVDGECFCGAVKSDINEFFIINGKTSAGGAYGESAAELEVFFKADKIDKEKVIYIEQGTNLTLYLETESGRCWHYSDKTDENIELYYKINWEENFNEMGEDFVQGHLARRAKIIFNNNVGENASVKITHAKDEYTYIGDKGWYFSDPDTITIKVLSHEEIIKKTLESLSYPLYLSIGSTFDSLDDEGTHYIASDLEIYNGKQEHSEYASGYISPSIIESDDFIINEDGNIEGIFNSTGKLTEQFVSGLNSKDIINAVAAYNSESMNTGTYIYANDGKLITDSNKENYEIIPVAVKLENSTDEAVNGWYINIVIERKYQITYDLNTPSGENFNYKPKGATDYVLKTSCPEPLNYDAVMSEGLGKITHYYRGTTSEIGAGETVALMHSGSEINIFFLGWNTEKDGSGTMYAPGDKPEFDEAITLYAIWGAEYTVRYYQDSYNAVKPIENRLGDKKLIGIIGSQIAIKSGTEAGELNYYIEQIGDDYDDGVQAGSASVSIVGSSFVPVVYTKPDHVHTAGDAYMHNGAAHWRVCGTEGCTLQSVEDYLNAFKNNESGRLKEKFGYEEHIYADKNCVCTVCERELEHKWEINDYDHKCENCLLEGRHLDYDKNDICDICGAKGVGYYCPNCGGRGKFGGYVECPDCEGCGEITVDCPNCKGWYYVTCPKCGGDTPNCPYCDGGGEEKCPDCDRTPDCENCNGNRYILCPECYGEGCDFCDDAGEIDCPECEATGRQICATCHGEEWIVCTHCDGSGYGVCDKCYNYGEIECTECDGYGTVDITCPNCHGYGEIDLGEEIICPVCHGTAFHTHEFKPSSGQTHSCPCGEVGTHSDEDMDCICDACDTSLFSDFVVVSLGAKINESASSLRLGAAYNGYILFYWEREAIKDLGMVFYPKHLLGISSLDIDHDDAICMSATAIEEFDPEKTFKDYEKFTFYVTIVGIPKNGRNTKIAFRPYIIFGNGIIEYGEVLERSYNDVVNAKLS